ncbi:MAG TPA: NAD+ synthase [Thermomicrobiales bacterium]|nr:NAD+ synthase [Thermomicrobiales bacterium]
MKHEEQAMALADDIANWIGEKVRGAGVNGAVMGLSGGIDSAVVSGLCAKALGPKNVLGVIMPIHSNPEDTAYGVETAESWGIEQRTIDLSGAYDALVQILPPGSDLANANIKPRLRMITLYHLANTMGRMVIGTGNRSELMAGYYTKYGDGGTDLLPIAGLYKWQVRELARAIGVPQAIVDKPPSAGLWVGQTDEQEMGISYADLDRTLEAIDAGQESTIEPDLLDKVTSMIRASEHKRHLPPIYGRE